MDTLVRVLWKATKNIREAMHPSCVERLRVLGLFNLEKRRLWEISSMSTNSWGEGAKETKSGSFQWCPLTGAEAMGANWNTEYSVWTSQNHFFTVRLMVYWHRLPRGVVESPSLETFKCLSSFLWVALLEEGGWTRRPPEAASNLNHSVVDPYLIEMVF